MSGLKEGVAHSDVTTTVLCQEVVPAKYAFVSHTVRPITEDANQVQVALGPRPPAAAERPEGGGRRGGASPGGGRGGSPLLGQELLRGGLPLLAALLEVPVRHRRDPAGLPSLQPPPRRGTLAAAL